MIVFPRRRGCPGLALCVILVETLRKSDPLQRCGLKTLITNIRGVTETSDNLDIRLK